MADQIKSSQNHIVLISGHGAVEQTGNHAVKVVDSNPANKGLSIHYAVRPKVNVYDDQARRIETTILRTGALEQKYAMLAETKNFISKNPSHAKHILFAPVGIEIVTPTLMAGDNRYNTTPMEKAGGGNLFAGDVSSPEPPVQLNYGTVGPALQNVPQGANEAAIGGVNLVEWRSHPVAAHRTVIQVYINLAKSPNGKVNLEDILNHYRLALGTSQIAFVWAACREYTS